MPLGDALDQIKEFAARTMHGKLTEAERSEISRRRRNTESMKKLGIASALGIARDSGKAG